MGLTKANVIGELWAKYYNTVGNSNVNGAAFQLAIWKIENDWGSATAFDNFGVGNFQASATTGTPGADALGTATTWLDYLNTHNGLPQANLVALTNPTAQDQVIEVTPEPSSLALAGLFGLCLAGYAWRRRRLAVA
jgi:hypothetical protein